MTPDFWQLVEELKDSSIFDGPDSILPEDSVLALTKDKLQEINASIKAREREIERVLSYKEAGRSQGDLSYYTL